MKFGQRIQDEAPPELASVMFRYTDLKLYIKEITTMGENGSALKPSSAEDGQAATPMGDSVEDFSQLLRDELARCSTVSEGLALALTSELAAMQASGDDSAAPDIYQRIDSLHRYVVLTYIGVFKIIKKFNRHSLCSKELAALPFLVNAPVFSSRMVQVLLQRAAKNRQEQISPRKQFRRSLHDLSNRAMSAQGDVFGAVRPPRKASTGPISDTGPDTSEAVMAAAAAHKEWREEQMQEQQPQPQDAAGAPRQGLLGAAIAQRGSGEESGSGSVSGTRTSSAAMAAARSDADGCALLEDEESPAQNVCCNLCVRKQNRFVVLGCAHSFCWPCISSTALRLPPSEKEIPLLRSRMRSQSRDSLRGISPHGSLGHPTTMELGTTPVGVTLATPTGAGGGTGAGWWPGESNSDSGAGTEDPRSYVKCAVCDSLEDLTMGHMEVNPLLGDYSYIWIAAPLPKNGRNHGTSQSQLAGINFGSMGRSLERGSLSAFGSMRNHPLHMAA